MSGPLERFENNAVEITSTLVTGIWLAALLTGQDWWLGALILGYVAVVPIVEILTGRDEEQGESEADEADDADVVEGDANHRATGRESTDEALATLRERYANGELTDEQFERKLERILEVETVEDASEYRDRSRSIPRDDDEQAHSDEREREPEYS